MAPRAKVGGSSAVSPGFLEVLLKRDRMLVTLALVTVSIASWLFLLTGAGTGMYPHEMAALIPARMNADPTMSGMSAASPAAWTPGYVLVMVSMWWVMMTAMMFPTAAPMVYLHAVLTRKARATRNLRFETTAFVGGYLAIWGVFSLLAVGAQWALEREELLSTMMTSKSTWLGSGLLLAAGVWQLTPLKTLCLRQCRSPISFLSAHWRAGVGGAFKMGGIHGMYCLGCCWFLMTLLFFGGVMNLIWIAGLTMIVLVEKMFAAGVAFARVTGATLIGSGIWLGLAAASA